MQIPSVFATGEMFVCTLILTAGFCLMSIDFVLDIEQVLCELNVALAAVKNKQIGVSERVKMQNKLIDGIQFHAEAKQLSIAFSNCLNVWKLFSWI